MVKKKITNDEFIAQLREETKTELQEDFEQLWGTFLTEGDYPAESLLAKLDARYQPELTNEVVFYLLVQLIRTGRITVALQTWPRESQGDDDTVEYPCPTEIALPPDHYGVNLTTDEWPIVDGVESFLKIVIAGRDD